MKIKSLRLCAFVLNVLVFVLVFVNIAPATAQSLRNQNAEKPINIDSAGNITYLKDSRGNHILDYSLCGYRHSDVRIPNMPVAVFVSHSAGDQSARIQKAIDYVSSLKPDKTTGFRGAVLLDKGNFSLSKALHIAASGVVLRGISKTETKLVKQGVDRGAVVYIEGRHDRQILDTLKIKDDYVPVGSTSINVQNNSSLNTSHSTLNTSHFTLTIVRPSTTEWIASIGCEVYGGGLPYWGWKAGEMDVRWDRTVVSSKLSTLNSKLELDAPLTVALDKKWGEAYALVYSFTGRIDNSGVENLTIEAAVDAHASNGLKNEDHAWDGIYIDAAQDCWVRQCNFYHLAGSAVIVQRDAQQVTVEDCISKDPVSEIGGLRRRTFLTLGGKCLFQRCYSEGGINDFSAGYCAPGPNAFVQCDAMDSHSLSGSSSSWATGLLFDNCNIEGGSISFKNLGLDKWGAGWNTANSVLWQCMASELDCYDVADDARCFAFGCWSYCQGDGYWFSSNDHILPRSLFAAQLTFRRGAANADEVRHQCRVLSRNTDASSSPTEQAAWTMAQDGLKPRLTLEKWINDNKFYASVDGSKAKSVDMVSGAKVQVPENNRTICIKDGVITLSSPREGQEGALLGSLHRAPWWNGRTRYSWLDKADFAVTRFVPGYEQRGGTDRMDSVVVNIRKNNVCVWNQNYGLWYDRRRDDHERIRRPNADVWAPFYEQAFQRSGEGQSFDGLSKYDLTKVNRWYFSRVKELANAVPDVLIVNQHLFQHNILEAGAHWVDCPWRTVNNINNTGFLEPVPFSGDKRIFTAEAFYDVFSNTPEAKHRAELYKQYFFQQLDSFALCPNVYHSISEEYTGPLTFTRFWLDCVAEWNAKTGRHARIILNANKDVTESLLKLPQYRKLVDIIEIENWFYDSSLTARTNNTGALDFKLYAPKGGKNLAPRQHHRLTKTGHPTFYDTYRGVAEMRQKYPEQAVLYYAKDYDHNPWGVVMAGGSCAVLNIKDEALLKALPTLKPVYPENIAEHQDIYVMKGAAGTLLYNPTDAPHTYSPLQKTVAPHSYLFVR